MRSKTIGRGVAGDSDAERASVKEVDRMKTVEKILKKMQELMIRDNWNTTGDRNKKDRGG